MAEKYDPNRNYEKYSEVKSEVFRPFYKVRFDPGYTVYYCGEDPCHLAELIGRRKELCWRKTEKEEVRYKIGYFGQRSSSHYNLRGGSTDPRLGVAKRYRDSVFKENRISDDDDYSVAYDKGVWVNTPGTEEEEDSSEEEIEDDIGLQLIIVDPTTESDDETEFSSSEFSEMPIQPKTNPAKRDKILKHHLRTTCNNMVINEAESLKEIDCKCAEAALKYYNEQNDTNYEIVETLGSYSGLYDGVWYHCNFRARGDYRREPKIFFAELFRKRANTLVVGDCKMLEGSRKCVRGCKICGNELLHPIGGFTHGC